MSGVESDDTDEISVRRRQILLFLQISHKVMNLCLSIWRVKRL